MKSFFSIIHITLNANLNEKISVGLFMSNGHDTIFKFSNPKLNIIKELVSPQKFNILKNYFKNLSSAIAPKNNEIPFKQEVASKWLNESYFSYLHKYSNNLVSFSNPKTIELPIEEDSFKKLFNKYIFHDQEVTTSTIIEKNILKEVERKLYRRIEEHVNLNVQIGPQDFEELITPVDINFIGRNGVIVAGQTVDFDKRSYFLENDLTRFISFTKAADYSDKAKRNKYFLVGQEPNKTKYSQNHKTWKHVKDSHLVEYVDLREIEKIREYIESKNVMPFFEKNNELSKS